MSTILVLRAIIFRLVFVATLPEALFFGIAFIGTVVVYIVLSVYLVLFPDSSGRLLPAPRPWMAAMLLAAAIVGAWISWRSLALSPNHYPFLIWLPFCVYGALAGFSWRVPASRGLNVLTALAPVVFLQGGRHFIAGRPVAGAMRLVAGLALGSILLAASLAWPALAEAEEGAWLFAAIHGSAYLYLLLWLSESPSLSPPRPPGLASPPGPIDAAGGL